MPKETVDRSKLKRASGFEVTYCGDPNCGPHILIDIAGKTEVEMVLSPESAEGLIRDMREAILRNLDPERGA